MRWEILVLSAVFYSFVGCSDGGNVCAPNTTALCNCTATSVGVQACNEEGTGYGECTCEGSESSGIDGGSTDTGNGDPTPDADDTEDVCQPNNFKDCIEDEVWYFDSCGKKQELLATCFAPAVCTNGICVGDCEPNHHLECNGEGDAVYSYDSCGNQGSLISACPQGTACVNAQCISACTPHEYQDCYNDQVYWFDACDEPESVAEICGDDQFCANATCVKPYFNGNWKMVADPNTKDACGLGNSTYPPQTIELEVDGEDASASLEVIGIFVNYSGSVINKHMELTGEWDQVDNSMGTETVIHHEETISIDFTSPSAFEGTHADKISFDLGELLGGAVECTLYWLITAEKQ